MPQIELLQPRDIHSPVSEILKKSGVTPYHACYEVDNIEEAVLKLKKMRYVVIGKPVEAVALGNRKVCFLYNKEVGLIELLKSSL